MFPKKGTFTQNKITYKLAIMCLESDFWYDTGLNKVEAIFFYRFETWSFCFLKVCHFSHRRVRQMTLLPFCVSAFCLGRQSKSVPCCCTLAGGSRGRRPRSSASAWIALRICTTTRTIQPSGPSVVSALTTTPHIRSTSSRNSRRSAEPGRRGWPTYSAKVHHQLHSTP